ncbi:MAG: hypothetical protein HQL13_05410 [Candidatus Omnitrophica bacterium]|nr:hypothetical protein [Candidatus Omnitrophota bacterium]
MRVLYPSFLVFISFVFILGSFPGVSWAKDLKSQEQIILLNDAAAALEDSDPEISQTLSQWAQELDNKWQDPKSNKDVESIFMDPNKDRLKTRIQLLKTAAKKIENTYPLIAKSLNQMEENLRKAFGT